MKLPVNYSSLNIYRAKNNFIVLLPFIMFLLSACEKEDKSQTLCDPTPQFNIDLFIQNVNEAMNNPANPVAGYQFTVNQNGNLYHAEAEGNSVYASDPGGPVEMTEFIRMNVASVSKFIGTIALMQVLEKHGIQETELIRDYLPQRWKDAMHTDHYEASSVNKVTFEKMLQMKTGLRFSADNTNWSPGIMPTTDQMYTAITLPADPARVDKYQNGNFTLIRVLITELEYGLDATDPEYNFMTAEAYFDYIKRNIFDKLGIDAPMTISAINNYYDNTAFTRAHQYPFDSTFRDGNNNVGWGASSDPELNGGSGGLVLSSMDLAKILAYFVHDNVTIISKDQREIILDKDLGLWGTGSGDHGKYSSKGGTRGPETDFNRAIQSMVMMFPNGVEAVLLVNSNKTDNGSTLRTAFDEAWVSPCD